MGAPCVRIIATRAEEATAARSMYGHLSGM